MPNSTIDRVLLTGYPCIITEIGRYNSIIHCQTVAIKVMYKRLAHHYFSMSCHLPRVIIYIISKLKTMTNATICLYKQNELRKEATKTHL